MSTSQDVHVLVTAADPTYVQPMDPSQLARLVWLSERAQSLLDREVLELCALALEARAAHDRLLEAARTLLVTGDAWRAEAVRLAGDRALADGWARTAARLKGGL